VEVWQTSNLQPLAIGEEKKKKETTAGKYNGLPIAMGGHNQVHCESI